MSIIKTQKITIIENVEKLKLLCTVGENVKWYSYRIQYGSSSKLKHRSTIWFNNSNSGYILKRMKEDTWIHIYTCIFKLVLFIIQKMEPNPFIQWHVCINKMGCILNIELLFSLKKEWNSDTCCNIEESWKGNKNDTRQTQKDRYYMIWQV